MSPARTARRVPAMVSAVLMAIGIIGFAVALALNTFVFDNYHAYGEVPVPGTGIVTLPEGEVTVSLHTRVISSPTGGGLPVPPLSMQVQPPAGVAQPAVEESIGITTTVNNDSRRRVWRMQVPAAGDYRVTADGQVGGFIAPRLAFGHASPYRSLAWVFAALSGLGAVGLIGLGCQAAWRRRRRGQVAGDGAEFDGDRR